LTYAPLLLLIWSAVRFGVGGLSSSMLVIALISIWKAMYGRVLVTGSMTEDVLALHTLLAIFALPLLLMAAVIAERRRAEESSRAIRNDLIRAQEQDRHRIARELRDGIIQQLTLVASTLSNSETSPNPLLSRVSTRSAVSLRVSMKLPALVTRTYPFALEYLGLSPALRSYAVKLVPNHITII